MTNGEMESMYGLLFSVPGMEENVKVPLNMSRKMVLLLNQVVETGLGGQPAEALAYVPKETVDELRMLMRESLEKSGLAGSYERLKQLDRK